MNNEILREIGKLTDKIMNLEKLVSKLTDMLKTIEVTETNTKSDIDTKTPQVEGTKSK